MKQKLLDLLRLFSFKLLFAIGSFLVALYVFGALTHEIFLEREEELDQAVFKFLSGRLSDGLIQVMRFFTFFGKPQFLIPAYIVLIILLLLKKK